MAEAPFVGVEDGEEAVVAEPVASGAVDVAPGGAPLYRVAPLGMGSTGADAEAPIPTSPPWAC